MDNIHIEDTNIEIQPGESIPLETIGKIYDSVKDHVLAGIDMNRVKGIKGVAIISVFVPEEGEEIASSISPLGRYCINDILKGVADAIGRMAEYDRIENAKFIN